MKRTLVLFALTIIGFVQVSYAQWVITNIDESSAYSGNTIKFRNDSLGILMGSNSLVLKSEDAGESWREIVPGFDIHGIDFQFINDSIIYAVGYYSNSTGTNIGRLIISDDRGETWSVKIQKSGQEFNALFFSDKDTGLIAGYDKIYRTVDGGESLETVWSITSKYEYGDIKKMSFPNSDIGYAIGRGRTGHNDPLFDHFLLKTSDTGKSWQTINTFNDNLSTIHFLNSDTGYLGLESGVALKTINGGIVWDTVFQIEDQPVSSIQFNSDKKGRLVGGISLITLESWALNKFFIAETSDGGNTWEVLDTIGIPLKSVDCLNDTLRFVSGSYSLIMKSSGNLFDLPDNYPWELVSNPSAIEGLNLHMSSMKVYPNPTDDFVNVELEDESESIHSIIIYSSEGKILKKLRPDCKMSKMSINLRNMVSGMYLLQVNKKNSAEIIQVIKKN